MSAPDGSNLERGRLRRKYRHNERANGKKDVLIISGMLSMTFVFVRSATRRALVDTGEHRSPKNMPERIAPPESMGFTSMAFAIVIHITPVVAAVPKDVPVRKEIKELTMKTIARKDDGFMNGRA